MSDPLQVSPEELRRTAKDLADTSSKYKSALARLNQLLNDRGTPWGDDKTGHQFADGEYGYKAQVDWVNQTSGAKVNLLDHYSDAMHTTANLLESHDQSLSGGGGNQFLSSGGQGGGTPESSRRVGQSSSSDGEGQLTLPTAGSLTARTPGVAPIDDGAQSAGGGNQFLSPASGGVQSPGGGNQFLSPGGGGQVTLSNGETPPPSGDLTPGTTPSGGVQSAGGGNQFLSPGGGGQVTLSNGETPPPSGDLTPGTTPSGGVQLPGGGNQFLSPGGGGQQSSIGDELAALLSAGGEIVSPLLEPLLNGGAQSPGGGDQFLSSGGGGQLPDGDEPEALPPAGGDMRPAVPELTPIDGGHHSLHGVGPQLLSPHGEE
jgi:uncharacterized protein YukE